MAIDRRSGDEARTRWLQRQATLVVSQLPDDDDEAIEILDWAKRLIEFLRLIKLA
jgi:hypothetical protein